MVSGVELFLESFFGDKDFHISTVCFLRRSKSQEHRDSPAIIGSDTPVNPRIWCLQIWGAGPWVTRHGTTEQAKCDKCPRSPEVGWEAAWSQRDRNHSKSVIWFNFPIFSWPGRGHLHLTWVLPRARCRGQEAESGGSRGSATGSSKQLLVNIVIWHNYHTWANWLVFWCFLRRAVPKSQFWRRWQCPSQGQYDQWNFMTFILHHITSYYYYYLHVSCLFCRVTGMRWGTHHPGVDVHELIRVEL